MNIHIGALKYEVNTWAICPKEAVSLSVALENAGGWKGGRP